MSPKLMEEIEPKIEMGWAPDAGVMPSGAAVAALMAKARREASGKAMA